MIRTFVQVFALLMIVESTIFLYKSTLLLKPSDIANLSRTKWDYDTQSAKDLSAQQADTKVGTVLLLLGLIFQFAHLLWPMSWNDFKVNPKGVALAVLLSILIGAGSWIWSGKLRGKTDTEVTRILQNSK